MKSAKTKKTTGKAIDFRHIESADWEYYLSQGGVLADALNMRKEELDAIYALAFEKYQGGNFKQALTLFQLLCHCNHFEAKFMLGLGACRQGLKEYTLAGETYSFAALIHPMDPRFPYHAAECHLALGNWMAAGSGFEVAVERSNNRDKYFTLNKKAQQQFSILVEKLHNRDNEKGES